MLVLKDVNQINERLNSLFKLSHIFDKDDYSFVNEILPQEIIEERVAETGLILGKENLIEELSLLIFQLKNYVPALCNLTNMFLLSRNYDAVYYFTTKLFVSHIGNATYQSEGSYNYTERFFDRFIEIVKSCKILPEDYIPFILEIFKTEKTTPMINWRAPALKYMKVFYAQNTQWVENFLLSSPRKFEMMSLLCQFNTSRGLALALEFFTKNNQEEENFINLFKQNKKEVLLYLDKNINKNDTQQLTKFAKILLSMENDTDAKSRLEEIYKLTDDIALRNLISQNIGIVDNSSYKTEKQFLLAVRKQVKDAQERVLGLVFDKLTLKYKSGLKVDNAGYTFLINIFKEDSNLLNLHKYNSLKEIFDIQSLNEFLNSLYKVSFLKQDDINASKWAVRLIALLGDKALTKQMLEFSIYLAQENRIKECRYLLLCLINAGKPYVFDTIKTLCLNEKNFAPIKDTILNAYANYFEIDVEEVKDFVVSENYDAFDYTKEKKRLFDAFLSGRMYSKPVFEELFINHKLFNKLAQGLVFGEYRYGGLHNAFIVKDKEIKFVVSKALQGDDVMVGIIHPQDCDMRFQAIYNIIEKPTFNQFEEIYYNVSDFSRSSVSINVFAGMMIKPYEFASNLEAYNFKINKEENSPVFNSFINVFAPLNIVAEIELEKTVQLSTPHMTVANLYFYRLTDTIMSNGKVLTSKQNAVGVGAVPYRYFAYILTSIINSVKKII